MGLWKPIVRLTDNWHQTFPNGDLGLTKKMRARTTAVAPNPATESDIQIRKIETTLYPNSIEAVTASASATLNLIKKFT